MNLVVLFGLTTRVNGRALLLHPADVRTLTARGRKAIFGVSNALIMESSKYIVEMEAYDKEMPTPKSKKMVKTTTPGASRLEISWMKM